METKLEQKTISSEEKYNGYIIKVREDKVLFEDGVVHGRDVIEHPGGVVIAAVTEKQELILIKQWRHPIQKEIIELPAGKLEYGEDPFECAKRELEEETGYVANNWEKLGAFYSTPGFCDEKLHIYKASGLKKTQTNFDEGEYIETFTVGFKEVVNMVKSSEIEDAKTIATLTMLGL